MSEVKEQPKVKEVERLYTFSFMKNILEGSRHQTTYVKSLESVSSDPMVSWIRIGMALVINGLLLIASLFYLFNDTQRLPYVLWWHIGILVSIAIMSISYMLPMRGTSILQASINMMTFMFGERLRRASTTNDGIDDVGIKFVKRGVIYLSDGKVALLKHAEGQLSKSVLPKVANATAGVRLDYLISRPTGTYEKFITSIREVDVESQLELNAEYYRRYKPEHPEDDTLELQFFRDFATMQYEYIQDNLVTFNREYAVKHLLMIIADDGETLRKYNQVLEEHAREGLYSNLVSIVDSGEIVRALAPYTMLSVRGENAHVEESRRKDREKIKKSA